jgi:hypothetical protein
MNSICDVDSDQKVYEEFMVGKICEIMCIQIVNVFNWRASSYLVDELNKWRIFHLHLWSLYAQSVWIKGSIVYDSNTGFYIDSKREDSQNGDALSIEDDKLLDRLVNYFDLFREKITLYLREQWLHCELFRSNNFMWLAITKENVYSNQAISLTSDVSKRIESFSV